MPRYKLTIEYDGEPFVGWQRQENGLSVQGALEDAVFAFCGKAVEITVTSSEKDLGNSIENAERW